MRPVAQLCIEHMAPSNENMCQMISPLSNARILFHRYSYPFKPSKDKNLIIFYREGNG